MNAVRRGLRENPRVSVRRNGTNIPRATFNRIVRLDLNWLPYRMQRRHEIKDGDFARGVQYGRWFDNSFNDPGFLDSVNIGDEASFPLTGRMNTQNIVEYSTRGERTDWNYDLPGELEKVSVRAGLCGNGRVLGPFFYDFNLTGEAYVNLLNKEIVPQMMEIFDFNLFGDALFENVLWFQDGAPPHRRNIVTARLRELFGNHVVALNWDRE